MTEGIGGGGIVGLVEEPDGKAGGGPLGPGPFGVCPFALAAGAADAPPGGSGLRAEFEVGSGGTAAFLVLAKVGAEPLGTIGNLVVAGTGRTGPGVGSCASGSFGDICLPVLERGLAAGA